MTDPVVVEAPRQRRLGHWSRNHPAFAGEQPTLGERAADRMRHAMGSWLFVGLFLAVMASWAAVNASAVSRLYGGKPFDPYPYILLNLLLSTLAGLQGAVLLIAAKRADQVAGKLALHTDLMATEAAERDARIEGEVKALRADVRALLGRPGA